MEVIFRQLETAGKANVEHLTQWMKESKIIKDAESNAWQLFKDVADPQHVDLATFKDILGKIAGEQSITAEQLSNLLATEGPKFIESAKVGLDALTNAFNVAGPASLAGAGAGSADPASSAGPEKLAASVLEPELKPESEPESQPESEPESESNS